MPIKISSYQDHLWCDIIDINAVHILLCKPWLYDFDVSSFGRSNTYEFKFSGKKIVLKHAKSKFSVGNQNIEMVTGKESKKSSHLVNKAQFRKKSKEGIMYVIVALVSLLVHMQSSLLWFVRFSQILVISCPMSYLMNFLLLEASNMPWISCQGPVCLICQIIG